MHLRSYSILWWTTNTSSTQTQYTQDSVVFLNSALCSYVTELTENIQVKAQKRGDEDFMRVFPSFIWSVRDFTLRLEKEGKAITADQYLESALELKTGEQRQGPWCHNIIGIYGQFNTTGFKY